MLTIWKSGTNPLSVGLLHGTFSRSQVIGEINRAYGAGDMVPGQSRLLVLPEAGASMQIAVSDLSDVQQRVAHLERTMGEGKRYKSVFVASPTQAALTLDLYTLLWQSHSDFIPEFYRVQGLETAEVILGCGTLKHEFLGRV